MQPFLSLNLVDEDRIAAVVGRSLARAIRAEMVATGGFGSWLDAGFVRGVGEATLRKLAAAPALSGLDMQVLSAVPSSGSELPPENSSTTPLLLQFENPGSRSASLSLLLLREGGGYAALPRSFRLPARGSLSVDLAALLLAPGPYAVVIRADQPLLAHQGSVPLQAPARAGHLPAGPAVVVNHSEQSVELWLAGQSLRLRPRERRSLNLEQPADWHSSAPLGLGDGAPAAAGKLLVGAGGWNPQDRRLWLQVATAEELAALPGLSATAGRALVAARERGELQSLADLLGVPGLGELRLRDLQGLLRSGTPQAGSGDPAGASPPEGDPPGHPIDLPGDHIDHCSLHYSRIERDLVIEGRAGMRVELARIYQFRRCTAPEQWPDDGLPPGWNLCFPRVFRGRLLHAGRALALPSALPFAPPGESITLLQAEAGPSAGWILDEPTLRWWLDAEGRPVRVAQHPDRNAILFQWEQGRLCRIVVAEDDVVEAIWEGTFLCGWRQPAADLTIQFVEEEVDGLRLLRAALDPLERATHYEWQVDVSGARLSRLISPGGGELRLGWQADRIAERMLITNALEGVQTAVCVERWRRESEGEASLTILENGSAVQIYRFVPRSSAKGAPMDLASEGTWHGPYLGSPPEAALALRYYLYQRDPLHGHPICIEEYRQGGLTRRTELVYSGEEARWGLPTEVSDLDPDGVLLRRRITLFGAPFPGLPTRLDGDVDVVTTYRYPPDLPLPVLQVEDPDGLAMETESVYDAFGNLVERCFPGEIVEEYSWVPRGALAAVDRGGYTRSVSTNTYEWTEVQSRNSHRWTDPDGGWEQVDYDRMGRPLQRQRSDAPPEQWQYEDATDRRHHEQPGRATRTTLGDGLGGAHGEERSDGSQRRRWWQQRDTAGRACRLHAPGRAPMEVDWDSLDRVWQEKSPDGSYLHRQWDDRMAQHTVGGDSFWADREVLSNRDGICRETFKDPLDRVVAVREWEGLEELVWIWHYDGAGRVVEELEPGGLSHRYNYDGLGRLIEHVCGGATEYWTYDEAGNVASHTDMDGYTTGVEYNDSLQVRAIIAPDGGRTELTGAATAVEERSPSGRRVSRRVEERGVVVEDDDGFVERLEGVAEGTSWIHRYERRGETTEESRYNGFGELLSVNGPQGRVEMERDDAGRVVHLRSEEGEFSFSYHPITGLLQQVDGPEGSTTIRCNGNEVEECAGTITQTTRLDPKGRPFEVQEGEALRRYRYGAWGGAEVDADGVEQSWSMDPHSQTMVFRDTAGEQSLRLSPAGRVRGLRDGLGVEQRVEEDAGGRPLRLCHPSGADYQLSRDADGLLTQVEAPGFVRELRRSSAGVVTGVGTPGGVGISVEEQRGGRPLRLRDGVGVWNLDWDDQGRIKEIRNGEGKTWTLSWEEQKLSIQTPENDSYILESDARGRVAALRGPAGVLCTWDRDDDARRLTVRIDGAERIYTADEAGRLASVETDAGCVRARWSPEGRLKEVELPSGERLSYGWRDGRLGGISQQGPGVEGQPTLEQEAENHSYDAAGRLVGIGRPAGASIGLDRDSRGRIEVIRGEQGPLLDVRRNPGRVHLASPGEQVELGLDGSGRIAKQTRTGSASGTIEYGYAPTSTLPNSLSILGHKIDYRRNEAGQLKGFSVVPPGGAAVQVSIELDSYGRRRRISMGPAAEETRDYDAATGDIEQKAGSLWHYHCLTYFYTGMRRARRVVARARPPVDRRYLRPSAEKVETQWLGVGPAYNRYEVGSVLPRPPALPGDQARQGRYTLTLEAGKVLEEWQLGSDPKSGNDWELFGDGSPKSRLIWQDQVDEARQERRIDLMYDADGLVRGSDQIDRETPATTGTQLLYDAAGRLRYFRLGFVESNKWEQCYLRWDGLDRLVAVGFEPDPPVVLRDPSGRVIGLSDGQRWLRDGRRVVAGWKPAGSTGELFNPMVIVPDDDGEPLMIVRAPRDNFPSRAFLLVPQADGTPDAWMSSDGRVHSPGDALNNLNPQDVEHGAAVIDAGGQGPLETPPLAPMHQPFGRFGGQYLVARRGQQWPELLEVGGVAWSPTMGRALVDDPCSLAERLVRLSLQLYPTFRKETAGWERPLRRGPQTPIPQPEPVVLNPEPTWGELAFTVLAGVCVAGGVAAVAAMGTVPAVIAGAAALSYGVYSSYRQRDAEWDLVGYQPTAYERMTALAADMTETSSVYAVWYGEDLVNGQPVGPKARLGMVLNAVLPGFVGTRVTRRIHTRRMIQVADEITPGDLLKITGETTAKYGGTFEGRTLRTVLGLRDPQLQRYVGNLRRRLGGIEGAIHVVKRRAAGLEGEYEAGLLTWTLKDALRYFALDNPRKPGVKGFVQHHLDFLGSDARKVWTAGRKSAREQLRLNANVNRTLKETRRPPPYKFKHGKQVKLPDDVDVAIFKWASEKQRMRMGKKLNDLLGFEFVDLTPTHGVLGNYFDTGLNEGPYGLKEHFNRLKHDLSSPRKGWERLNAWRRGEPIKRTRVVDAVDFARNAPDFIKPSTGEEVRGRVPLPNTLVLTRARDSLLSASSLYVMEDYLKPDGEEE